jgi:peptide/nickel transport system substrate-binding protein
MAKMTGTGRTKSTVLGAAVLLAACGSESGQRAVSSDPFCQQVMPAVSAFMEQARSGHPTPDDPRYGGTVVVGGIGELSDGMNAAVSTDYYGTQHQQFVNLMPLVLYDANLELRPNLAESWELAPDGRSVTFHLRDDVYWHDGELTDADDVRFTYEVVTDPLTAFPNATFWNHYVKGPEGVEVLDDFTVRIHMEPHSEPLDPFWTVPVLPEHLLGDVPRDELRMHPYGTQCPVGNGPFVFAEHRSQDRWIFEANPAFPQELGGRPFFDRYVYRSIPEETTLLTELLTENIDIYIRPAPDQAQAIIDNPSTHLLEYTFRDYVSVNWNSRRPQLADPRVRRAITMGTNREEIVQALLRGQGTVANATVPPFHWAFDAAVNEEVGLPYDPEAARALLDEAGWTDRDGDGVRESADGTRLSFSIKYNDGNQRRQDIAEIMQSQLAQIGIEARPQVVEWVTLLSQINDPARRDFDGVVIGWVTEFRLDDTDLFHSDRIDQPYAWSGTKNPEIDRLLDEIGLTMDREKAKVLFAEYQRVLAEEQPYTFFYFPDRTDGVNNSLMGVVMDARGEWLTVKDWYRDPAGR